MVLRGEPLGLGRPAVELAAILSERDPLRAPPERRDPDLRLRLDLLRSGVAPPGMEVDQGALQRVRVSAGRILRQLAREPGSSAGPGAGESAVAAAANSGPTDLHDAPGLLLAFVVGGLNLAAATLTIRRSPVASVASLAAGASLLVFIITEVAVTRVRTPMQLLMFAVGAAIVLLAAPPRARR